MELRNRQLGPGIVSGLHEAMVRMGPQLMAHWVKSGRPLAPIEQIDHSLCEDGITVCIDWYLADGFHAFAFFTPEPPLPEIGRAHV